MREHPLIVQRRLRASLDALVSDSNDEIPGPLVVEAYDAIDRQNYRELDAALARIENYVDASRASLFAPGAP